MRPEEAVASIEASDQAYTDYYTAVADCDRGQFRLYHALGHPAQRLADEPPAQTPPPGPSPSDARVVPFTPSP